MSQWQKKSKKRKYNKRRLYVDINEKEEEAQWPYALTNPR
jgi:hypothetical protein